MTKSGNEPRSLWKHSRPLACSRSTTTWRSNRPGRTSAGSSTSGRLVAAIKKSGDEEFDKLLCGLLKKRRRMIFLDNLRTKLDSERIEQIVDVLHSAYDIIILDLGRSLSRISLPLIQKADLITLIVSTDQSTITRDDPVVRIAVGAASPWGDPQFKGTGLIEYDHPVA